MYMQMHLFFIQMLEYTSLWFQKLNFWTQQNWPGNLLKVEFTIFLRPSGMKDSRMQLSFIAGRLREARETKSVRFGHLALLHISSKRQARLQEFWKSEEEKNYFPPLHIIPPTFQIAAYQQSIYFPLWPRHVTNVFIGIDCSKIYPWHILVPFKLLEGKTPWGLGYGGLYQSLSLVVSLVVRDQYGAN